MPFGSPYSKELIEQISDKEIRDELVADRVRTRIANMIRALREQGDRRWSQTELGRRMNKPQSVVSRLEDPEYGKLSLQTLLEVAAAFDLPLIVEMPEWEDWFRRMEEGAAKDFHRVSFSRDRMMALADASDLPEVTSEDKHAALMAAPTADAGLLNSIDLYDNPLLKPALSVDNWPTEQSGQPRFWPEELFLPSRKTLMQALAAGSVYLVSATGSNAYVGAPYYVHGYMSHLPRAVANPDVTTRRLLATDNVADEIAQRDHVINDQAHIISDLQQRLADTTAELAVKNARVQGLADALLMANSATPGRPRHRRADALGGNPAAQLNFLGATTFINGVSA